MKPSRMPCMGDRVQIRVADRAGPTEGRISGTEPGHVGNGFTWRSEVTLTADGSRHVVDRDNIRHLDPPLGSSVIADAELDARTITRLRAALIVLAQFDRAKAEAIDLMAEAAVGQFRKNWRQQCEALLDRLVLEPAVLETAREMVS